MRIKLHDIYSYLILGVLSINTVAFITNIELILNNDNKIENNDSNSYKNYIDTLNLNEDQINLAESYFSNNDEYLDSLNQYEYDVNSKQTNTLYKDQLNYVDDVSDNHLPVDTGFYDDWTKMSNIDGLYTSLEEYGQESASFTSDWYSPNGFTAVSGTKYPDNTYISDNLYSVSETTDSVILTTFNLPDLSDSIINGIEVQVEAKLDNSPVAINVSLMWNSKTSMTTFETVDTMIGEQYYQFGSLNYDWGRTWLNDDLNNSNFGLLLQADTGSSSRKLYVDHVRLMLNYTLNNFVFDREFSISFNSQLEENFNLNIKTGLLDDELLNIDYWEFTSNSWQTIGVLSSIDSNSWKNISIDSLTENPEYNFRFKAFSESDDSIKDTWEIDSLSISYRLKARHFTYRKNITLDSTKINSNLQDFPFLLELYDSDIHDKVQSSGNDILFADETGKKLAHEIELFDLNFNASHSYLISWIQIPILSSITDTVISLYFGNETIESQDTTKYLWNSDYLSVQHMEEEELGSIVDSASYNITMFPTDLVLSDSNSIIGNGVNISEISAFESTKYVTLDNSFTVSFWFNANNVTSLNRTLFHIEDNNTKQVISLFINETGFLTIINTTFSYSFNLINTNSWYHTFITYNGVLKEFKLYINGTKVGTTVDLSLSPITGFLMFGENFEGIIDEWRVLKDYKSIEWIETEYINQNKFSDLLILGPFEYAKDLSPPEVTSFGVDDHGKGISTFWAQLSDDSTGVKNVTLKANSTYYQMTLNSSNFWIYSLSVNFNDYYEYQIVNASDFTGKFLLTPSEIRNITFNYDTVFPVVIDWEYYSTLGNYGTFNANITDSWGIVVSVLVNITNADNGLNIGKNAIMRFSPGGYTNDTLILESGTIYFVVSVNDTNGNTYVSNEHQGYVLERNHAPSITFSEILPDPITSSDFLELNYTFYDSDDDEELGTIIHWYINDVYNSNHDNKLIIAAKYIIKNDSWYAKITPRDGKDFGEEITTETVIIQNTLPEVTDYYISPDNPINTSVLSATYTFYDVDNDLENITNRVIEWYRNGDIVPSLDNLDSVTASYTTKGDNWYFKIKVHDSEDLSIWYTSTTILILNAAPIVTSEPTFNQTDSISTVDNIEILYSYYDADNDINGSPIVYWFLNGVYQISMDNQTILYSTNTGASEFWYYIIKVYDNYDYSGNYTSRGITIGNPPNNLPYATDLEINGNYSIDDLEAIYIFTDDDGHPEAGTEIRWWKSIDDGLIWILVPEYNDSIIIPTIEIFKDDQWKFGVHPKDGLDFGDWINSSVLMILNTAPQVESAIILDGVDLYTTDDLTVSISTSDYDEDTITDYWIKWFWYNITYQEVRVENQTILLSENTTKGDWWYCEVYVFDGTSWSTIPYTSNYVEILNTKPYITNITLIGGSTTEEGIIISYDFVDPDGDSDESTILWFVQRGTSAPDDHLADFLTSEQIVAGDLIYCFITPNDGEETGIPILTSASSSQIIVGIIVVGNTAPIITGIPIIETNDIEITSTTPLYANYSAYDRDGNDTEGLAQFDLELVLVNGYWVVVGAEYQWYKNGELQPSLDDPFVDYQYLSKDDIWMVRIRIQDRYGTFSGWYNSTEVLIGNSVPVIQDMNWDSEVQTTSTDIILIYDYFDNDGDNEGISLIYWYINDIKIDNDNQSVLNNEYFVRGDHIYVIIIPFDNIDFGESYNSSEIVGLLLIVNTKPIASNININNQQPIYTDNDLILSWTYFDYDDDDQSNASIIYWYLNGEYIEELANKTEISSLQTRKGHYWRVIVRVYDGYEYSANFTSDIIIIQNSLITIDLVEINSEFNFTYADSELLITYEYTDLDGDNVGARIIYWYINGVYIEEFSNQIRIPSFYLTKGDEVYCVILLSDNGFDWSLNKTSNIIAISNKAPSVIDVVFVFENENLEPISNDRDFYINDEDIILTYNYMDIDGDSNLSLIHWYLNGTYLPQFDGNLIIDSDFTNPGDIWSVIITPYDGYAYGEVIETQFMIIIDRPEISDYCIETILTEVEGQYNFWVNTSVINNEIDQVEFIITIECLNLTLPRQIITSNNGTSGFWVLGEVELLKILEENGIIDKNFIDLINTNLTIKIFVISSYTTIISSVELTFTIYNVIQYSFTIVDLVPPRVVDAWFVWNGEQSKPDNITFYAIIEEYGMGIDEIMLFYYFNPTRDGSNSAALLWLKFKLNQLDFPFESIQMIPFNDTHYSVTIPFSPTEDYEIWFNIKVKDQDGNINENAFPEGSNLQNVQGSQFIYSPTQELPWAIIIGLIILLIAISLFAIRFFSKTELVGLDIEAVMNKTKDITEEEVNKNLNLYTLGIVVSIFDQQHGPLPAIVEPIVMKDNFKTLIKLSDSSFRSSGFVENFEQEINTIFDFKLSSQLFVSSLTFAFALERPESRGGAENVTLNILLNRKVASLIIQFISKINTQINGIHVMMDKQFMEKDLIYNEILKLRKDLTKIVLAYEKLYGTTEYLEDTK